MGFLYFLWPNDFDIRGQVLNLLSAHYTCSDVFEDNVSIYAASENNGILKPHLELRFIEASEHEDLRYWYEDDIDFLSLENILNDYHVLDVDYFDFNTVNFFLKNIVEILSKEKFSDTIFFGEEYMDRIISLKELADAYLPNGTFGSWREK
jgi:hypothetical protein